MLPLDPLVTRIRGEYREIAGLRLTFVQACRLWQLDGPTCHAALQQLVDERVLCRTSDGAYIAFSSVGGGMAPPYRLGERERVIRVRNSAADPGMFRSGLARALDRRTGVARAQASGARGPDDAAGRPH